MVSYVLATNETKPRGEKTINKATMLRLLNGKHLSPKETLAALYTTAGGRVAATLQLDFLEEDQHS